MILEQAILPVRAGAEAGFEAAFAEARSLIEGMPGCRAVRLMKSIERPGRYLLLVDWERLEDHTEGFRHSPEYERWKDLLHPFYDPPASVEHFEPAG